MQMDRLIDMLEKAVEICEYCKLHENIKASKLATANGFPGMYDPALKDRLIEETRQINEDIGIHRHRLKLLCEDIYYKVSSSIDNDNREPGNGEREQVKVIS